MEEAEFDLLVREQQAEIDRTLDNPEDIELTCHDKDDGILGILRPTPKGRERATFIISYRDEDGEICHEWAEEVAAMSFFEYIMMFSAWENPSGGAVSPQMSAFFAWCHPETPALVNWVRWLRLPREANNGGYDIDHELAELMVEAAIAVKVEDATLADEMRRAMRGESLGESNPDHLDLF